MRSAVRKQLIKTFQREFESQYPQFAMLKLPGDTSVKVWEWRVAPSLHYFVLLQPFEQEDKFVLEIAWSEDGEFPWGTMDDVLAPDKPRWRRRLGRSWQPLGRGPVWDAAPEVGEARQARFDAMARGEEWSYPPDPAIDVVIPRIAPLVRDCLQKFQEYGLPIFKQVAQHRGLGDLFQSAAPSCLENRTEEQYDP